MKAKRLQDKNTSLTEEIVQQLHLLAQKKKTTLFAMIYVINQYICM